MHSNTKKITKVKSNDIAHDDTSFPNENRVHFTRSRNSNRVNYALPSLKSKMRRN